MKKTKTGRKMVLLLLAMLFSMPGVSVMAEAANAEEAVERTGEEKEMPANPVHHCTADEDITGDSDTTTWSHVYFGSYPQTEVTGDMLTAAIIGADYVNGDAWVDGVKYRRISKNDTNNDYYFGDSTYRYFKWERIRWRVLQADESTMFVMADKGLDCKCYNDTDTSVTWEKCTLRNWLNHDFYGTAFDSSEWGAIVSRTVVNEDNPHYCTEGGNDTTDKVFLLSIKEITNLSYGFCENSNTESVSRRVKASDYAHARGAFVNTLDNYVGNCWHWLRVPGSSASDAVNIYDYGYVDLYGAGVVNDNHTCAPVLYINLTSDLWSMTDDGTSGSGGGDFEKNLQEIKEELKEKLETYKEASDYREEQKGELAAAIAMGITAMNAAADDEEAKQAFTDAKTMIDQIKTDTELTEEENQAAAEALIRAKEKSKQELNGYKKKSDYREEQKQELEAAIAAGEKAIDAAEDEKSIENALLAAKTVIDQIKTDVQLALEEQKPDERNQEPDQPIVPKSTSIKGKIIAKSKGFLVKWKKQVGVTGYQIQYSTSKQFTKKTTKIKTVKKSSAKTLLVKKLQAKKKYFVRVRTYKSVNKTKYYSKWSKIKTIKTKK